MFYSIGEGQTTAVGAGEDRLRYELVDDEWKGLPQEKIEGGEEG